MIMLSHSTRAGRLPGLSKHHIDLVYHSVNNTFAHNLLLDEFLLDVSDGARFPACVHLKPSVDAAASWPTHRIYCGLTRLGALVLSSYHRAGSRLWSGAPSSSPGYCLDSIRQTKK